MYSPQNAWVWMECQTDYWMNIWYFNLLGNFLQEYLESSIRLHTPGPPSHLPPIHAMFAPLLWTCLSRKIGGCKSSQKLPSCWHWGCQSWTVPQHRSKESLGCSNLPQDLTSLLSGVQRHLLTADVWEQWTFAQRQAKIASRELKQGSSTASNHAATASDSSAKRQAFAQAETSHPNDMGTAGSRARPQHCGMVGAWCSPGPTSLLSWSWCGFCSEGEWCKQYCNAAVWTKGSCSLQVPSLLLLLHTQGPVKKQNKSWKPHSNDSRHRGNMHVERNEIN